MKRRESILVALASLLARSPVEAQQPAKPFRVGWLDYSSDAENLGTFMKAMRTRGWIEGKTFNVEYRGGEGKHERLAAVAAELVRLPVDVIIAPGTAEVLAARKASPSIPIVMIGVDDPVERGLVASLARPGGNVTGLSTARREMSGKLLSLLREFQPKAIHVAVLGDAADSEHKIMLRHLQTAARTLGATLHPIEIQRHTEVEPAFAAMKKQGIQMLIVSFSSMLVPRWIADLALKQGLPLASSSPGYAYEGGLMAFTDDWNAVFDRASSFVDRILTGSRPGDLPVELPTKFKLIVNAKTAQRLGMNIPQSILLRADHVLE